MTNQIGDGSTLDNPEIELSPEIEKPLDTPEQPSMAELSTERDNMVEANFEIADKMRQDAIEAGALNQNEAESFQILATSPNGRDIKKEYQEVTENIKNGSDNEAQIEALKQRQAELVIEYSYNCIAMLWKYYTRRAIQIVQSVTQQVDGVFCRK